MLSCDRVAVPEWRFRVPQNRVRSAVNNAPRMQLRAAGLVTTCAGVFLLLLVLANAYVHRNPDYSCHLSTWPLDAGALGIDDQREQVYGSWNWLPTGLMCSYAKQGGGSVNVMPEPYIAVASPMGVAGAVVGVGMLLVTRQRK